MRRFTGLLPIMVLALGCPEPDPDPEPGDDAGTLADGGNAADGGTADARFRVRMRQFVQSVSTQARLRSTSFIVIPQNGTELATLDGNPSGTPAAEYLAAISGVGREDLFYGYDQDDQLTPADQTARISGLLDVAEDAGVQALVTDYCSTPSKMDDSYARNLARGYLSFAADRRDLNDIPAYPAAPIGVSNSDITSLSAAKNFLYLLDASAFATAQDLVTAISQTKYDVIIIDAYFEGTALTPAQVTALKQKSGGGRRLVIAYMSIGEAEDYRSYWRPEWATSKPAWLAGENPSWPGNFKVRYWDPAWQQLILGQGGYLSGLLDAGFDGTYLDIIDAFEYFEANPGAEP
ncbi:MAG: endo alpha-1,4 polygalactosaminidase [Myxococcaceae bacterium]